MAHVMLIDDDRTNSGLIKMLLEMDGFTVTLCPDIARAKAAAGNSIDAFVVDCNLARGDDGIDLLQSIRRGETAAAADAVIIMTSGDDRRRHESMHNGADGFLLKPYPPSTLSNEISTILARGERRD
jgi:two-component system, OmpR family, response regulator CpxR